MPPNAPGLMFGEDVSMNKYVPRGVPYVWSVEGPETPDPDGVSPRCLTHSKSTFFSAFFHAQMSSSKSQLPIGWQGVSLNKKSSIPISPEQHD